MARGLVLGALLAAIPAGLLFPQEVSARFDAANILHIGGGEIGAVAVGADLDGDAGLSVSALRLASTVDELRFSAEAFSASVRFPVKAVSVSADISAASLHDIEICDTATFDSADIVVAGVSARIPLSGDVALAPFLKFGRLSASGGSTYGFKAVPEIPALCLFGVSVSSPALTVMLQGGMAGLSVRSEAASGIDSSGFLRQFMLLCGNRAAVGGVDLSWWGGALCTDGRAGARTERGDVSLRAEERFLVLGTGAEAALAGRRFFGTAALHALFLPLGSATAEFECDIRLLFSEIRKKYRFDFDGAGRYGLLLPRVCGGIRLGRRGRILIDKTFYVPLVFSAPSSGGGSPSGGGASSGGTLSGGTDSASLVITALLSGLSFGIRL